jgi:hypothetical protein
MRACLSGAELARVRENPQHPNSGEFGYEDREEVRL